MTYLTVQLVRSDLRAAPGRTIATAVLLAAACLLPALASTPTGVGAILAFAIAAAATIGTIASHGRRSAVLAGNGGGGTTDAKIAAATMVAPGALAVALAAGVGVQLASGPGFATILFIALVVPVLVAPCVALTRRSATGASDGTGGVRPPRSKGRTALIVVGWVLLALNPVFLIASGAYWLTSPPRSNSLVARLTGIVLAGVTVIVSTAVAGATGDWDSLGFVLVVFGPATAIAVAVLGTQLLELVGVVAGRAGPRARIALSPVTGRSRSLGPIVAILAVVTALAAMEATVGASFGQREADHQRTAPTVTAPAGASSDEAIGTVTSVDPAQLRLIAAQNGQTTGTSVAVIDRLGFGPSDPGQQLGLFSSIGVPTVYLGTSVTSDSPVWVGVVEPSDLAVLGLQDLAGDLEAGRVVVLNPDLPVGADGTISLTSSDTTRSLTAVRGRDVSGALLPGGLVSAETAAAIGDPVMTHRIVVTPTTPDSIEAEDLRTITTNLVTKASTLDEVTPTDMSQSEQDRFTLERAFAPTQGSQSVLLGTEPITLSESGPLNDVPFLADTRDEGVGRLIGLGALVLLMTVAGVGLALGATRAEDGVLRVQGAPGSFRAVVVGLQAAAMSASASLLGLMIGVAVPAVAFRQFNAHSSLPDIPLVVPAEVAVLLIGLPVAAAGLTAAFSLVSQRSTDPQLEPVDDLAF